MSTRGDDPWAAGTFAAPVVVPQYAEPTLRQVEDMLIVVLAGQVGLGVVIVWTLWRRRCGRCP